MRRPLTGYTFFYLCLSIFRYRIWYILIFLGWEGIFIENKNELQTGTIRYRRYNRIPVENLWISSPYPTITSNNFGPLKVSDNSNKKSNIFWRIYFRYFIRKKWENFYVVCCMSLLSSLERILLKDVRYSGKCH